MSQDSGTPLFPGDVTQWNRNQVRFVYWMSYYDAAYQAEDSPGDEIINNNKLLDQWFEGKMKERESRRQKAIAEKRGVHLKSAFQHEHVTIYD